MGDLIQLIVSGIATGAIYALAALGFTLLWQAAGVINFAQGEFVMLPAFAMLFFVAAGAPLWLAFLLTCAVAMLVLGIGFKRVIVDPLIRHGVIPLVIATLGLSIGLKSVVKAAFSAEAHRSPSAFPAGQFASPALTLVRRRRDAAARGRDRHRAASVPQQDDHRAARCRPSRRTPSPRACSASTSRGWCCTRSSSMPCSRSSRRS